jgi:hypothetical protein
MDALSEYQFDIRRIGKDKYTHESWELRGPRYIQRPLIRLYRVSRQIHEETFKLFYSLNIFCFDDSQVLFGWKELRCEDHKNAITSLKLSSRVLAEYREGSWQFTTFFPNLKYVYLSEEREGDRDSILKREAGLKVSSDLPWRKCVESIVFGPEWHSSRSK